MNDNLFPQMKIIETKDFILRPVNINDAKDLFEYYKEEKVLRYLPIVPHKNIKDTKKFIDRHFIKHYKDGKIGHYAIYSKKDKKVIGNIGFNNIEIGCKEAEMGICINPKYWGSGITTPLTKELVEYGFNVLNIPSLYARVYDENKYSVTILLNLGFKLEKTINQKLSNGKVSSVIKTQIYRLSKQDYLKNLSNNNKLSKNFFINKMK